MRQVLNNKRLYLYVFEIVARLLLAFGASKSHQHILTADVTIYWQRAHELSWHHLPYRDFLWEYPPLTIVPLLLIPLTGRTLTGFDLTFVPLMIVFEYASLCILRKADRPHFKSLTIYWSLTVVPLSMLVWYRFDYVSVLFATLALVAMMKKQSVVVPVVLGFLAKLWPIFILVILFAQRRYRQVVWTLFASGVFIAVWWLVAPSGFHTFLRFRQGNGFQVESVPGSLLLLFSNRPVVYSYGAMNISSTGYSILLTLMNFASVVGPVIVALIAWRVKRRNDVALFAAVIALVLCTDRLISSQFIVWMAPMLALMWPRYRRAAVLYGVVCGLTDVEVGLYYALIRGDTYSDTILVIRNLALIALTVELFHVAFSSTDSDFELSSVNNRSTASMAEPVKRSNGDAKLPDPKK